MNSFYWAKTAFVSLLMISSIPFKATCTGPVSALFNSLIVGITSANEGEHSAASTSNQRPLELKLADAQMLQQWIGQIARKIVVEDGIFAGNYLCCPNININAVILTDGLPKERIKNLLKEVQNLEEKSQFLKLLFSFGAMLSAEIGEQSQQYGTLRALLKAYECVGGQFKDISNFAIAAVIKSPIEKLKVDKIILESLQINNVNHRLIQEFDLLNALKISEMTPKDVINFASFIRYAFLKINPEMQRSVCNRYDVYLSSDILTYPKNPFKKGFLKINELSHSILGKDPIKYRRIAHQLLLHVKNWGPDELKKISSKKSDEEDVIKLTRREKCIFGIFTLNLLQRMAKFELFEKYFGELNMNRLVEITNENLSVYELFLLTRCNKRSLEEEQAKELKQKKKPKNDGIENSKFYPFFGEAIRIDWNIWTEIIQQIDELPKTVKSLRSKYQLAMHTESVKFENAMQIVKAKFDEKKFGLELKAKVKVINETTLEDEINQFCLNLAKIRQICVKNIKQYERKFSLKRNVIIKQKENHNKFYDFIANFVKHFGGNWIKNDNEESIEFDLNGAKSFLEKVYNLATNQIVKKNKSEEFECLPNKLNFETAIKAILGKNLNEKAKNLLKEFYVPKEIPRKSAKKEDDLKEFLEVNLEVQLFELFYSFAARLEAIVHGKNIDGTIEKSRENSKDKIRAFLAVPNCFNVPEWANKFSIFDYWMEIKEINSESQIPAIGVEIFRNENEEAKSISRENYKTLKRLNEHKFSFYESTKHLKRIYSAIGSVTEPPTNLEIPKMINPILSEIHFKWYKKGIYSDNDRKNIKGCELTKLFKNISANFMKIEGVIWHMDEWDSEIQAEVEQHFGKYCKKIEGIARKADLNTVRYDLVLNFKLNAWKDVHDRTKDLLKKWAENKSYEERAFAEGTENVIEPTMTKEYNRISKEMSESITKIEALKAKENDGFDLIGLFDRLDELTRKIVEDEMPNLEKAKKELEKLERLEWAENYKKKRLYEQIESTNRQKEDKEKEAKNLENEMNLLQNKLDKMPEKLRKNAAPFLGWLKSNGRGEITKETKQILQKICTLSELNQKVEKMRKSMRELSTNNGKVLQKLQKKLKESLGKVNKFGDYCANNLLELAKENCKDLNKKTQGEPSDYEKTVEELGEQIDEASHGVTGELDALLIECKIERGENELKSKEKQLENLKENLSKMNKEMPLQIAEIDKKLTKILMKKDGKEKEIDTLEKELKENKESAREMSKNFGQMLENVKKLYGQKMDE